MNESAVYNEQDLVPFQNRLDELREIVRHDKESGKHPEAMTKLLERKLNECGSSNVASDYAQVFLMPWSPPDNILRNMKDSLSELSVELIPIHERLVSLRRQLVALAAKERPAKADLKPIQEELREIDSLSASFVSLPHHLRLLEITASVIA